jgi:hypothetical protein
MEPSMRAAPERRRPSRWWTAGLTAVTVLMTGITAVTAGDHCPVPPPPPPASDCSNPGAANTHAARAYSIGLDASVLGIGIDLGPVPDTGQIPSSGGDKDATLVAAEGQGGLPILLPKRLSLGARILHNTAFGSGDTSNAYSSVTDLNLGIVNLLTNTPVLSVSAGVLTAKATVKCKAHVRTVDAAHTGSTIAKLAIKVLGVPIVIPANAPANTRIALPAALRLLARGGIVLNEQVTSNGRQVVNAVHINLEVLGLLNAAKVDLVISHAEANTTCGGGSDPDSCTCKARDYVTGSGTVQGGYGTASFSVRGHSVDTQGTEAARLDIVDGSNHLQGNTLSTSPDDDYGYQKFTGAPGDPGRKLVFVDCTTTLAPGVTKTCYAETEDLSPAGGTDKFGAPGFFDSSPILSGSIDLFAVSCGKGTP